jgi:hypothetical protein
MIISMNQDKSSTNILIMCPYAQREIGMLVLILLALYRWRLQNRANMG